MVKDRLPDLKLAQSSSSSAHKEVCVDFSKTSNEIHQFLGKVEKIQGDICTINTNVDEINRLSSTVLLVPRGNGQGTSEVEDKKAVLSRTINQVQSHIAEIEKIVEKDKQMPIDNLSTLARIQSIQHMTLARMFAKAVCNYNNVLLKHQERYRAIVRQQLVIIDKEATSEELENLLEKDGVAVFVDNIVADTLEAQVALANVKARHEDILKIENSIQEIRDIFVQMATMVETQDDKINRIDFYVTKTGGYTDHGAAKLQKTRKLKRRQRKRKYICVVILVILIGIVIILLVTALNS